MKLKMFLETIVAVCVLTAMSYGCEFESDAAAEKDTDEISPSDRCAQANLDMGDGPGEKIDCCGVLTFSDPYLEQTVRSAVGAALDETIFFTDLRVQQLRELDGAEVTVYDLNGIQCLTGLEVLAVYGMFGSNNGLRPLAHLTRLTDLLIVSDGIDDITPLSGLTELTSLDIQNTDVVDFSPLENLTKLTKLNLNNTFGLFDLSPLEGLTALTDLHLAYGHIEDITPLAGLSQLKTLELTFNELYMTGLEPLAHLTGLTTLDISSNGIVDLSPLEALSNLTSLNLKENFATDLSPLADLTQLTYLNLQGSYNVTGNRYIFDIAPPAALTGLETLYLDYNLIDDIKPLEKLTKLETLGLAENDLHDLSPLAHLTGLRSLWLSGNKNPDLAAISALTGLTALALEYCGLSNLAPLSGLTALTTLYLEHNDIADLSPLAANEGLAGGDTLFLHDNPLDCRDLDTLAAINTLRVRGAMVCEDCSEAWLRPATCPKN